MSLYKQWTDMVVEYVKTKGKQLSGMNILRLKLLYIRIY